VPAVLLEQLWCASMARLSGGKLWQAELCCLHRHPAVPARAGPSYQHHECFLVGVLGEQDHVGGEGRRGQKHLQKHLPPLFKGVWRAVCQEARLTWLSLRGRCSMDAEHFTPCRLLGGGLIAINGSRAESFCLDLIL